MNFDIAIECAETIGELNKKIEQRLRDGYELLGEINEVHLERLGKPALLVYGQHFIKWFPAARD